MQQLALFPAAPARSGGEQPGSSGWLSGVLPDRSGFARYVHLIRAPTDPERSPRPPGGRPDRAPHRTLRLRVNVSAATGMILELLQDGTPRTFNRIGVELLDQTADMLLDGPLDRALWVLVEAGRLEYTLEAPIHFRLVARCGLTRCGGCHNMIQ